MWLGSQQRLLAIDSTLLMCLFCRPPSVFSSQPATQAWWLTADCRCQSMLPLFAGAATINCINCDKLSDAHPLSHGPGFHYQSPRLVQLTVLRHHWPVDATSAVGAECCRQADHWQSTMWPHLTGASPAALASSVAARQLQDRHARSSLSVRPRPKLPGWRLSTRHWRLRSADTALVVGRTQSSSGDRTFTAVALRLWNSLPSDIRQPDLSYGRFRRSLKPFLFG